MNESPPIRLVWESEIRGPVEALARRPWAPSLAVLVDSKVSLDSDWMRAERMAGSRDCHVFRMSGGISEVMVCS